jgi:hypothetical protein
VGFRRVRVLARVVAAVFAVSTLAPRFAVADPTATDKDTARGLMDQADQLYEQKDYKAALKAYQDADAIMHVPTTGIEVAKTQEAMGLLVEASATARAIESSPSKPGEPAPFAEARTAAKALADRLAPRIPALQIQVEGLAEGVTPRVEVDGEALAPAALAAPAKVNPGTHVVVAIVQGYEDARQEVSVKERDVMTVTLTMRAGVSSPEKVQQHPKVSPLVLGVFGASAGAIVIGSITGIASLAETSNVKSHCNGTVCPTTMQGDISTAKGLAVASDFFFIVGAVGAGAGLALYLTAKPDTASPKSANKSTNAAASVRVLVGPSAFQVAGTF